MASIIQWVCDTVHKKVIEAKVIEELKTITIVGLLFQSKVLFYSKNHSIPFSL